MYRIKQRIADSDHPVALALRRFVTNQTLSSLAALKEVLSKYPDYKEYRELTSAIWESGVIFPAITTDLMREQVIPSILHEQDHDLRLEVEINKRKLVDLDSRIEAAESRCSELKVLIADCVDASRQYNKDIDDIYNERRQYKYSSKEYRLLTRESRERVAHLVKKAKQKEGFETQLSPLEKQIEALQQEQSGLIQSMHQASLYTIEGLRELQNKCQPSVWRTSHPVTIALGCFLHYPTPTLLFKLKTAMVDHPDFKEDTTVLSLLEEAEHYFPDKIKPVDMPAPKESLIHRVSLFKPSMMGGTADALGKTLSDTFKKWTR